jgi:hypothetical protein
MGQYYHPAVLGKNGKTVKKWLYSHDFDSGLKLMEHSWIENTFVKTFESLIKDNPQRVVWAGDYADECKGLKTNVNSRCTDKLKVKKPERYSDEVYPVSVLDSRFVINHSKKVYVDKINIPDNDGWRIHPLPLLTCEGNGRGGGDFRGDAEIVGTWARDLISVSKTQPEGYKEIIFDLIED